MEVKTAAQIMSFFFFLTARKVAKIETIRKESGRNKESAEPV